jgi:hypothetical protein
MTAVELAVSPRDTWRKIAITLKIRLEYQSVSDTWGLAKVVRQVEFKLLQSINGPKLMNRNVTAASLSRAETCVESSDPAS